MKTKTIAALKKKKKKRRREKKKKKKKKKRGKEGSNTGPISAQCCPKCARRETLDSQRSGIPHASPSPIQGSGLFDWVGVRLDPTHAGLELFFLIIVFSFLFGSFRIMKWGFDPNFFFLRLSHKF
jgi:hypothetical protein